MHVLQLAQSCVQHGTMWFVVLRAFVFCTTELHAIWCNVVQRGVWQVVRLCFTVSTELQSCMQCGATWCVARAAALNLRAGDSHQV